MTTLTLYSKPDCCLCDEMLDVVERVRQGVKFDLDRVDVSNDPELLERFGSSVPVLAIDGEIRFEHAVSEGRLKSALDAEAAKSIPNGTVGATT